MVFLRKLVNISKSINSSKQKNIRPSKELFYKNCDYKRYRNDIEDKKEKRKVAHEIDLTSYGP